MIQELLTEIDDAFSQYERTRSFLDGQSALFRSAFFDSPIAMALVKPSGLFIEVNDEACTTWQRKRDWLLSHRWQDITHPDDLQRDLDTVSRVLKGQSRKETVVKRYILPDGSHLPAVLSYSLVSDTCGPVCFVSQIVSSTKLREFLALIEG